MLVCADLRNGDPLTLATLFYSSIQGVADVFCYYYFAGGWVYTTMVSV